MAECDADPDVMLGDKGYDSDAIRDEVRARGGTPEIPTKKNRLIQHTVNRALYATRNRIERFFTGSRTAAASQPDTIIPPAAFLALPSWPQSNSGWALSTRHSHVNLKFAA
jgi:transposase